MIRLASGSWAVGVAPAHGGVMTSCTFAGQHMLRPVTDQWARVPDPTESACFPLVPYSNRIAAGRFAFEGAWVEVPPTHPDHPLPLHGHGWMVPWEVTAQSAEHCVMVHRHKGQGGWPWAYCATQTLTLSAAGVAVALTLENESDRVMPGGIGLHPYFPRAPMARLQFSATSRWAADDAVLPTHLEPLTAATDFSSGLPVAGADLDHCYAGWDRQATVRWTDRPTAMAVSAEGPVAHAVCYTPPGADFFCFEPVTHMNNGVNWRSARDDTGVQCLAPGARLSMQMTLSALPA